MKLDTASMLKEGFSDLEDWKNHEIPSEKSEFGDIGKSKVDALKKSIDEIHEMIKGREKLSRKIHEEGENLKSEVNGYLSENERIQISSEDTMRERDNLRNKRIEVSELQMNEKLSCWKDVALLKKELREYERELTEKEERAKAFERILGDENGS